MEFPAPGEALSGPGTKPLGGSSILKETLPLPGDMCWGGGKGRGERSPEWLTKRPRLWLSCLWLRSKQLGSQVVSTSSCRTGARWLETLSFWVAMGGQSASHASLRGHFFFLTASWGRFFFSSRHLLHPQHWFCFFRGTGRALCVWTWDSDPRCDIWQLCDYERALYLSEPHL